MKKMYKVKPARKTELTINKSYVGEPIEDKIARIMNNQEAIKDGAPQVFQERKEGVHEDFDIRSDRFDRALETTDKIAATHLATREARGKLVEMEKSKGKKGDEKSDSPGESEGKA